MICSIFFFAKHTKKTNNAQKIVKKILYANKIQILWELKWKPIFLYQFLFFVLFTGTWPSTQCIRYKRVPWGHQTRCPDALWTWAEITFEYSEKWRAPKLLWQWNGAVRCIVWAVFARRRSVGWMGQNSKVACRCCQRLCHTNTSERWKHGMNFYNILFLKKPIFGLFFQIISDYNLSTDSWLLE